MFTAVVTAMVFIVRSPSLIPNLHSDLIHVAYTIYNIQHVLNQVGDERRATRGMEDLDFHIGDEAMNVGNPYAVKVLASLRYTLKRLICPFF